MSTDEPLRHAQTFMRTLLSTAPESMYALLWTLADKASHWEPLLGGADLIASKAVDLSKSSDVYVGVSVVDVPGPVNRRTSNETTAGLYALWADIDIADPDVHKKWNLPPDEASARQVLAECGLEPTLLVHSGHGLQAWWLFTEFWRFDTENDRHEAYGLAQKWNNTLRVRAGVHHWQMDSTFDLGRVMRIPGTINRKTSTLMPVRLIEHTGKTYNRDDFERHFADETLLRDMGIAPVSDYEVGELLLSPDRWPDGEWLAAFLANAGSAANDGWKNKPSALLPSGSERDLSLLSLAVDHGATDQILADLLIARRKQHPQDDVNKGLRRDYVVGTIRKARNKVAAGTALEDADEAIVRLEEAQQTQDDDDERSSRRDVFDRLKPLLGGIVVSRFLRYISDPNQYGLLLADTREITFVKVDDLRFVRSASGVIMDAVGLQIPPHKPAVWFEVIDRLLRVMEDVDIGAEATEAGRLATWLEGYLITHPIMDSMIEANQSDYPWRDAKGVHIWVGPFRKYLWTTHHEQVSDRTLGRMLKQSGCTKETPNVPGGPSGRTQRTTWLLALGHEPG